MGRFGAVLVVAGCGLLLWGCGADTKRRNVYDLYELRPASGIPTDNDSYYVPPRRAECTTIGDNPSCSGV